MNHRDYFVDFCYRFYVIFDLSFFEFVFCFEFFNSVPSALIDGIELDLPKILAQTPAEDKLELYVKYFSKSLDMSQVGKVNEAQNQKFMEVLNDIGDRLTALEGKVKKKK
mgnify:CR=1 FL=1